MNFQRFFFQSPLSFNANSSSALPIRPLWPIGLLPSSLPASALRLDELAQVWPSSPLTCSIRSVGCSVGRSVGRSDGSSGDKGLLLQAHSYSSFSLEQCTLQRKQLTGIVAHSQPLTLTSNLKPNHRFPVQPSRAFAGPSLLNFHVERLLSAPCCRSFPYSISLQ